MYFLRHLFIATPVAFFLGVVFLPSIVKSETLYVSCVDEMSQTLGLPQFMKTQVSLTIVTDPPSVSMIWNGAPSRDLRIIEASTSFIKMKEGGFSLAPTADYFLDRVTGVLSITGRTFSTRANRFEDVNDRFLCQASERRF